MSSYSLTAASYTKKYDDGSVGIFKDGKLLSLTGKHIYTIDEANAVAGKTNSVKIRYR